ncbi:hypothetical protein ACHAO1_009214 [Botrytis cinerea]
MVRLESIDLMTLMIIANIFRWFRSSLAGGSEPQKPSEGTSQAHSKNLQKKKSQHNKHQDNKHQDKKSKSSKDRKKKPRHPAVLLSMLEKLPKLEAKRKTGEEADEHPVTHNNNSDEMELDEPDTSEHTCENSAIVIYNPPLIKTGNNTQIKNKQPEIINLVSSDDESLEIKKEPQQHSRVSTSSGFANRPASLPTELTKS